MITLNAIGHSVAGRQLFTGISLSLQPKKYGLVGPNGVGKTTLAKIIAGGIVPSSGSVVSASPVRYLAQAEAPKDITLGEYLCELWEDAGRQVELADKLVGDLDLDRSLRQLSGGEWMRARLARLLAKAPAFLILDEPSNNLDRGGRENIREFVAGYNAGLLLISHDRELLEETDATIELSNQGASLYGGSFSFYWEAREKEREAHEKELAELKRLERKTERESQEKRERQEKRMSRGKKFAERTGLSRREVQAGKRTAQKTMGRLCRDNKERMGESSAEVEESRSRMKRDPLLRLDFKGAEVPAGKTLVSIDRLNWQFAGCSRPLWASPLDLCLRGSQRCHFLGENGSGKSTLAKLLVNRDGMLADGNVNGELKVSTGAIAYLDQAYGLLDPERSIFENLAERSRYSTIELRNELAFYGFTGERVFQKVRTLSGGELLKASLAHIFLGERIPELLILDEPTNNLDLLSIGLLEQAVSAFRGAVVIISHDREFVDNLGVDLTITLHRSAAAG